MMIARADYMLLPGRFCIVGVNEIEIGRIGNALEEQALSRLHEGVPSHVRDRAILGKLYNVARYETKTIRVVVFAAVGEEELHTEAYTDERVSARSMFLNCVYKPSLPQYFHGLWESAYSRQNK
jgi:hypothetical protein